MLRILIAVTLAFTLAACASKPPARPVYYSTYKVRDSGEVSNIGAERTVTEAVASGDYKYGGPPFDQPVKLLRAPQPAMSPTDTDQRVTGGVTADMSFNAAGFVTKVTIVRSTKQSLAEAVTAALSKWQISPLTRGGLPTEVTVRQSFSFKVE